ncbi:MAG: hypothetical protein AABY31_02430 [Thermoproteota archaeon]
MDKLERQEQLRAIEELVGVLDRNYRFTTADICNIHKLWLGKVYDWQEEKGIYFSSSRRNIA